MTSPTLDDLKAAQVTLQAAVARQDGYDGNNPAKHATAVRLAREEVNRLTRALKASGVLTRTAHEQLEARLDAAYPSARHKDEVDFEGGRYARWARPATRSLSGRGDDLGDRLVPARPFGSSRNGLERIDIHRIQIMDAAMWTKAR